MPLKFLKKCRQYNVTSKSLFVISVHHLLDTSSTVDCTISSESKGQECLDNVCQRLLIQQPEFFGLRYLVKSKDKEDEFKWIELERSLSRQLEKNAAGPKIYLRVRHYVTTGVRHLNDEATRFYYFLQLKSDIYEGRIACDIRTAILLALYCRQAEYDSYQGDKQSKDYLKKSLVLPRNMQGLANDDNMLEGLIVEVLQQQAGIAHLGQSQAEEMYIQCCQQLDGYGEERFAAKDTLGNDLLLGLAINGMVVNADNGRQYFPWKDFHTVTIDKRTIKIEQNKLDGGGSIVGSFIFSEADTARYFWKLTISQHKFFKRYIDTATPSSLGSGADGERGLLGVDSVGYVEYDYVEAATAEQLQQHQQQIHQQQQMISSNISLAASANQLVGQSSSCQDLSNNNLHGSSGILHHGNSSNNNTEERERLKAMLPTYRPAPDYETAVQLKYSNPSAEFHNVTLALAAPGNAYYAGSQPDVHNTGVHNESLLYGHLTAHRYPDVAQPAAALHHHINLYQAQSHPQPISTTQAYLELSQRMHMMRHKAPPPYVNRLSSSSTPDLAVASHRPLQGYRNYVSGSSPDLVSNRTLFNGGQFVALAAGAHASNIPTSSGATMMHQYQYVSHMGHSQPYLSPHGTFENLNMIEEQPSIMSQLRQSAISQAAATVPGAVVTQSSPSLPPSGYRSPVPPPAISPIPPPVVPSSHKSGTAAPLQRSLMNGSIEPIYENVPLPQRASGGSSGTPYTKVMRQRASSIQSAPGVVPVPAARKASTNNMASVSINSQSEDGKIQNYGVDRSASTELLFLEPQATKRSTRAASAAPDVGNAPSPHIGIPPTPRQHRSTVSLSKSTTVDVITPAGESLQQQFSAMNLSANTSASNSSMYNSTLDTTSSSAASKELKRKKRWNFLSRSKTPEKQKSATLGREKATTVGQHAKLAAKLKLAQDDLNLPHRWSTAVSKTQPISGRYSKDKLCQILDEKLRDSHLFMEFERIPKRRDHALYECALLEENEPKNHDPNFLPYDDNRVRLTPSMDNRHGYVNASYISATVGTKQRFYIVAQSPHEALNMRIFWQCVWEADVYLVVQLTEDMSYIPLNSLQRLEFGQFQVYQEFSQTTDRCTTIKLRLYHIPSRRYRSVWYLQYADWAEQNCPRDVNHFLDFLEELNSVRLASTQEVPPGHNTNPPVLLHCLEGGGRSGVTLTADLLLYTLDHNEDLDIPRVIGQLRHQRDSIIPSLAQYKFIYNLLITYLKRTRLI
ncbi:tyrosine-protein phosphatase non-receptor type 21 isoform X1 [Drosophila takahashii]|uniref:tyrosine-protein phosphatase non-receptor type 21 isoform X1 n=2 Tax=Drosophila takahashii TaxID=29030 RepID=UPI001CF9197E|nr:tyrosine-protein phosphatase non-receptor type 21 [Drosophila takahashii]